MNAKERQHLDRIHQMNCIVCGAFPTEAHHCIHQQNKTRDHFRTLPLCREHHTGPFSIHRARKSFRARYGHEEELLERVQRMLDGQ